MAWRQGQAYSQDLRDRVLQASGSVNDIARRFGVSASYVSRARTRLARQGQRTARRQCNHVPPRLGALEGELLAQVRAQPDQSLEQLRQWAQARGVGVSATTIWKSLARLGLTLKKRPSTRKSASVPM
jgi:transposase